MEKEQQYIKLSHPPTSLAIYNGKLICANKNGSIDILENNNFVNIYKCKENLGITQLLVNKEKIYFTKGNNKTLIICLNEKSEILFNFKLPVDEYATSIDIYNESIFVSVNKPKIFEISNIGKMMKTYFVCGRPVLDFTIFYDHLYLISVYGLAIEKYNFNDKKILEIALPDNLICYKIINWKNQILALTNKGLLYIENDKIVTTNSSHLDDDDGNPIIFSVAKKINGNLYLGSSNGNFFKINNTGDLFLLHKGIGIIVDIVLIENTNTLAVAYSREPVIGKFGKVSKAKNLIYFYNLNK